MPFAVGRPRTVVYWHQHECLGSAGGRIICELAGLGPAGGRPFIEALQGVDGDNSDARVGGGRPELRSGVAATNSMTSGVIPDLDVSQAEVAGKREKSPDVKSGRRHVVECKAKRRLAHGVAFL